MSGSFLGRWSRRKRGLEAQPEPSAPAPRPEAVPAPVAEPEFDLASLPPLDSLDAGGDLTAFLHPKVPALLRQAALRRAWASDPGIRDFTGPADYAWDYNAPDGVPGFSFDLGNVDMKKLLAQMIGEPQPPEDKDAPEADPGAAPEAPPRPAEDASPPLLARQDVPLPDPLRLSATADEPLPAPELQPEAEPEPEAAPPPRRRHGGALPRLG